MEKSNKKEKDVNFGNSDSLKGTIIGSLIFIIPLVLIAKIFPEEKSGNLEQKVENVVTDSSKLSLSDTLKSDTISYSVLADSLKLDTTKYSENGLYFKIENDGTNYVNNSRR